VRRAAGCSAARGARAARRPRAASTRPARLAAWLPLAAGAGCAALAACGGAGDWAPVQRRSLERSVEIAGVLEATSSDELRPPQIRDMHSFTISFLAAEGSELRPGDPAIGFDGSQLEQRLLQARADLDAAEKNLDKRRSDLAVERENAVLQLAEAQGRERRAQLQSEVPADVVAVQELELARLDHGLARDEVGHYRAALERLERRERIELLGLERQRDFFAERVASLERDLGRLMVRAPRAGVLVYKSNWRREKKKVGDTVWWAEALAQLPDLAQQRAVAEVDEVDAGRVAVGQRAELRLDAYPDRAYPASVVAVQRAVQRRSWRDPRRIVRVELALDRVDVERMRPGMRFTGELTLESVAEALVVPLEAVVSRDGRAAVLVDRQLGREWVEPRLGRRAGEWVEVLDGLREGERVRLRPESPAS
jgi:HlyD family secretion protein